MDKEVTSIQEIKERMGEKVVELPGFDGDDTLKVKMKRLSLLDMAQGGEIPNDLLGAVYELYGNNAASGKVSIDKLGKTLKHIARCALVSPTMDELEENGVMLTDEQLTAIYLYNQQGARALRMFRRQSAVLRAGDAGKDIREKTE